MNAVAEQPLEESAALVVIEAKQVSIQDQYSYDQAVEQLSGVVALRKQIVDHHAPMKSKAWDAHKAIVAAEKALLEPVEAAESVLKAKIGGWTRQQLRIEAESNRKAAEEAELKRLQEIEDTAVEAEQQGATTEEVQAIIAAPVVVPRLAPVRTFEPAKGISTAVSYQAEVVNIRELCRAIADGKAPASYVNANLTALNQAARAMRQDFNVPGCRVTEVSSVRVGGRK